jgi:hypothetical protein
MAGSVLTAKKPEPTRARGVGLARLSQWTTNFPVPVTVVVHRVKVSRSASFAIIRVIRGHNVRLPRNCPPITPMNADLLFANDWFAMVVRCVWLRLAIAHRQSGAVLDRATNQRLADRFL